MKTSAARVAALRQRHKDAGRVAVTVYVRPEHRAALRAFERGLQASETQTPTQKSERTAPA
jgi:hypothetical protein